MNYSTALLASHTAPEGSPPSRAEPVAMAVANFSVELPPGVSESAAFALLSDFTRVPEASGHYISVTPLPDGPPPGSVGARYSAQTREPKPPELWTMVEYSPPTRYAVRVSPSTPGAADGALATYEFGGGEVRGRVELDPGDDGCAKCLFSTCGCCFTDVLEEESEKYIRLAFDRAFGPQAAAAGSATPQFAAAPPPAVPPPMMPAPVPAPAPAAPAPAPAVPVYAPAPAPPVPMHAPAPTVAGGIQYNTDVLTYNTG